MVKKLLYILLSENKVSELVIYFRIARWMAKAYGYMAKKRSIYHEQVKIFYFILIFIPILVILRSHRIFF